jgi:hypothetical protein
VDDKAAVAPDDFHDTGITRDKTRGIGDELERVCGRSPAARADDNSFFSWTTCWRDIATRTNKDGVAEATSVAQRFVDGLMNRGTSIILRPAIVLIVPGRPHIPGVSKGSTGALGNPHEHQRDDLERDPNGLTFHNVVSPSTELLSLV